MNALLSTNAARAAALSLVVLALAPAMPVSAKERELALATTTAREVAGSTAIPGDWRVEPAISLAARSDYLDYGDHSASFRALAATAQVRFVEPGRPFTVGVLVEYSVMQDRSDTALVAAIMSYRTGRWTFSFAPFIKQTIGASAQWREQTTARYRLGARSSLGVELIGPLQGLESSRLSVGYYGTYSKSLSFAATVGRAVGSDADLVCRTSIIWHLR